MYKTTGYVSCVIIVFYAVYFVSFLSRRSLRLLVDRLVDLLMVFCLLSLCLCKVQEKTFRTVSSSSMTMVPLPSFRGRFPGGPDGFLRKRILPFRRLAKPSSSFCRKVSSPSAISVNCLALQPLFSSRLTSSSSRPVSFSPSCWTSCL